MSPVRATFRRTVGRARGLFSTAVVVPVFFAVAAVSFAFGLESAEGGKLALGVVWATSVAPCLPVLAALLGMEVWSDERQSGRLDLLLTLPVRERDYTVGKFLGVYALSMFAVMTFLAACLGTLWFLSPAALADVTPSAVILALASLALQDAAWCAVAVAMSAVFRRPATAACVTVILLVIVPRGLWEGLKCWSADGRVSFGEMPLDAHVVDISSGLVPVGVAAAYLAVAVLFLLVATKAVAVCRQVGRGARMLRLSTFATVVLSVVLAGLFAVLGDRVNPIADLAVSGASLTFSQRTRNILSETGGTVTITAFLSRKNPVSRFVGRLLRALKRESESVGGARIELRFVDPRWDIGSAERMVRRGIAENTLVFENGRRRACVPVDEGLSERVCASAIRRISAALFRRNVYWTTGHGEIGSGDYGPFGMSDIVRDLSREGYGTASLDLSANAPIPGDCALVLVAGAREDFSRAELGRLNAYLHEGGRLLVLADSAKAGGVVSMLPSWGLRPVDLPIPEAKTLSGTDVIVSDFADHPITMPLKGSRIVLERPTSFLPSSVAESGAGVDRIGYLPVAKVGSAAVVAAAERGVGAGDDLALRPMRIVVIGDAGFVQNGQLKSRAGANRDFFLNAVAYLSGADAYGSGEKEAGVLSLDLDRARRRLLVYVLAVVFPGLTFLLLSAVVVIRRRRS